MSEKPAQPDPGQPQVHRPGHHVWMGLEPSIVMVSLIVALGFGFHEHHQLNVANARLSAYPASETAQPRLERARALEQREEESEVSARSEMGAARPDLQQEPAGSADDDAISE